MHLRSHLPPGVSTLKHRVEAARNHDVLKKNRDMLLERLNKNDPGEEESSIFKFGDEILMLCATIEIFTFIDTFTNTEAAAMYLSICIIL